MISNVDVDEPPEVAAARGVVAAEGFPVHEASRTDLAEDRTILANERTFAGWMRTALACVAIGVGFHALFLKMQPSWMPRAIATAFLLLAIVVIVSAQRRAAAVMQRLSAHVVVSAKQVNLRFFSTAISLGSLALIAAIWLLELQ